MVTLLVGARYGVSQVVNHKLSIMTTLTEFCSITRIELLPESERVSLVKIYLQEIKVRSNTHAYTHTHRSILSLSHTRETKTHTLHLLYIRIHSTLHFHSIFITFA